MIRWNDEQLAAAGIDKRRLRALERRLRAAAREMQAMELYLHFDQTDAACLVHCNSLRSIQEDGNRREPTRGS